MEQDFLDTNIRLRRASWRFLLPGMPPQKTICFAGGELAKEAELISHSIVDPSSARFQSCDLAVAINPSLKTIQSASIALQDGGKCYFEWSSSIRKSAAIAPLRYVGFAQVRWYLVLSSPDKSSSITWIPLDASSVVEYYLTTKIASSVSYARRLIAWTHRFLFRLSPQMVRRSPWLIVPRRHHTLVAVARKPERTQSAIFPPVGLIEQITKHFRQTANNVGKVSILMNIESTSTDLAVVFAFADRETTPRMVVKVALGDWEDIYLQREAKVLKILEQKFTGIDNIPKLVFTGHYGDHFTQAQTYVAGIPLTKIAGQSNFDSIAISVTDWLILLAKQTLHAAPSNWSRNLVRDLLATLAPSIFEEDGSELLSTTARNLENLNLCWQIVQHRDFGPWNIHFQSDGQLGVIDWAEAAVDGVPASDLIYCLTMLVFQVRQSFEPSQIRQAYRELNDPDSATGKIFIQCLERYLQELNLSKSLIPQLRLLTWAIHTSLDPDDKRTASNFFLLWQEEINTTAEVGYGQTPANIIY